MVLAEGGGKVLIAKNHFLIAYRASTPVDIEDGAVCTVCGDGCAPNAAGERNLFIRVDGRASDALRPVKITPHYLKTAEASALIEVGDTKVLCAATVDNRAPAHLRDTGTGWVTAEYAMLPRSSAQRVPRERVRVAGRSQEIQRLIGRALRSVFLLDKFGERTITIDCDVLQADGGTRTAAITGGCVALALAAKQLKDAGQAGSLLMRDLLAGVSVGIVEGQPVLDMCYLEDAQADVDMNVVMTRGGELVEVQGTAEKSAFSRGQMNELMDLAEKGIRQLAECQREALGFDLD